MWQKGLIKKDSGGGGFSIEYVGQITSATGYSSAKSVDLKTGTYARADYAELTADNFIVLPVRSNSYKSVVTDNTSGGSIGGWTGTAYVANKYHEYTPSTGTFKFYGGYGAKVAQSTYSGTKNASLNYDIFVCKPPLSTIMS